MFEDDTIAAIATAPGPAGVSIIRISGIDAFRIASRVCGASPAFESGPIAARYSRFRYPETGNAIDDGVVLFFKGPHSYTGEDVVELQGHGGRLPSSRLLAAAIAAGARMAEPGEFTRRAFLNGKLDLTRAEAVMDFVSAASDRAAIAAREQLDGRLSNSINTLFDDIVSVEADVERLLDFDEGDVPADFPREAAQRCRVISDSLSRLVSTWRTASYLREGALVVISGPPNVGKSSLLNAILGRDRAIVSPVAGTTRDSIEEPLVISGIPVRLVDTAGLRRSGDAIEAEGVSRAEDLISRADLVIEVSDASNPEGKSPDGDNASNPAIRVLNKMDIANLPATLGAKQLQGVVCVSAKTGTGIPELLDEIARHLDAEPGESAGPGVSERHRACLEEARTAMLDAAAALDLGDEGLVIAAEKLAAAADSVGRVTGRVWSEELLDTIFGRFCIGK